MTEPRWERRANYVKSAIRAVSGHLRLMHDTLVFMPHPAERALFADDVAIQLSDIAAIEVDPRNLRHVWSGGLRPRLALVLRDGRRELFVVSKLDEVAADLRELAELPGPAHS